jgi:hypothetical protein
MFLWGQDFERDIAGLDILGLRRLDQNLEARLVNGITTISQRARYFTILPWAIGEFFADESASGATTFDETRFRGHLGRVEFLVLAATVADPIEGDASGLLGPVTFSSDMNALRTGQDIAFPVDHADTMLNTYLGPCRAIGILKDAPRGSPVPIELTPRGQQLWAARNAAITNADMVKAVIRDGDSLGRELCIDLADLFSLKRLDRGSEEARLLREALTKEWRSDPSASDAYPRFNGTVELLRASTAPRPLRAERFLADRYLEAVRGDVHYPIWLAWAEYEWRARLHLALEMLFGAVYTTLREFDEASIEEIVEDWKPGPSEPKIDISVWPEAASAWSIGAEAASRSVSSELFLGAELFESAFTGLRTRERVLLSFAVITALAAQTGRLRANGRFKDHREVGEVALSTLEEIGESEWRRVWEGRSGDNLGIHGLYGAG